MTNKRKRRKPVKFGDLITMDHSDMQCTGIRGFRHVFPMFDVGIEFCAGEACSKLNHVESMKHIKFFVANDKIECCYADGARGVEKAVEDLGIPFQKSEPGAHRRILRLKDS